MRSEKSKWKRNATKRNEGVTENFILKNYQPNEVSHTSNNKSPNLRPCASLCFFNVSKPTCVYKYFHFASVCTRSTKTMQVMSTKFLDIAEVYIACYPQNRPIQTDAIWCEKHRPDTQKGTLLEPMAIANLNKKLIIFALVGFSFKKNCPVYLNLKWALHCDNQCDLFEYENVSFYNKTTAKRKSNDEPHIGPTVNSMKHADNLVRSISFLMSITSVRRHGKNTTPNRVYSLYASWIEDKK